jgi:hypothetical protein
MIILWVRKRKEEEEEQKGLPKSDDRESFQKHDEIMKKFRISHPDRDVKIVHASNILNAGGNLLAPVDAVRLDKNKQN